MGIGNVPLVQAIVSFFAAFDGPAWTTLVISSGALTVSAWALWRSRVPQPAWQFVGVARMEQSAGPAYTDGWGKRIHPTETVWVASLRQKGPGSAEYIQTQVRSPTGEWTDVQPFPMLEVGRHGEASVILCKSQMVPGTYRVRVLYRALPNTRRQRKWECSAVLTEDDAVNAE